MEHSKIGVTSFVIAVLSGLLFLTLVGLSVLFSNLILSIGNEAGFGFMVLMIGSLLILLELLALGLGIAGALQRQRKRLFAFLGIACSICVLVFILTQNTVMRAILP